MNNTDKTELLIENFKKYADSHINSEIKNLNTKFKTIDTIHKLTPGYNNTQIVYCLEHMLKLIDKMPEWYNNVKGVTYMKFYAIKLNEAVLEEDVEIIDSLNYNTLVMSTKEVTNKIIKLANKILKR